MTSMLLFLSISHTACFLERIV